MNLDEILCDSKLEQDDWTLTRPKFGKQGQLELVGYFRRSKRKYCVVKCSICSEDQELFGEGYFKISKKHLIDSKVMPCGCGVNTRWTKHQFDIICSRFAETTKYNFLGFVGDWEGNCTKIKLLCELHGEWCSGNISNFLKGRGCPQCGKDALRLANTVDDGKMISEFFRLGDFPSGTKFWRSPRKIVKLKGPTIGYWYTHCPICDTVGESTSFNLRRGHRPCDCSPARQRECYINSVLDEHGNEVALKFGIANVSDERIKRQNRLSIYKIVNKFIYVFPSRAACIVVERSCKQQLECCILSKDEVPDGWTETTHTYNLNKIISIYTENGGILYERV